MSDPSISGSLPVNNQVMNQIQQQAKQGNVKSVPSQGNLSEFVENTLFNPTLQAQRFKDLEKMKSQQRKEAEESPDEIKIIGVESSEETATKFQQNNPELSQKTLLILASLISKDDTVDDIINKIFSIYSDPSLADEALDFLILIAKPDMREVLKMAKEKLNLDYERQIKIGKNIGLWSREFSKEGLGSPTALRDMYKDVTSNKRDPLKLFNELADKFNYPKLKNVVEFLLHSLGADLKSKGPSIEKAELLRLIEETRSLQGILGVFRFFLSRNRVIDQQFDLLNLKRPLPVNFEVLSRILIRMLVERGMSPEKILETAKLLGIDDEETAQIIVYSQMHDALRQISPRYYRSPQHRNELAKAFTDTLEKLEKTVKEKKEEEKQKKKREKKKDKEHD